MDVLPFISNVQDRRLKPHAVTLFANQFDIRQELHLYSHRSVALAGLTAAAGNVKRKVAWRKTVLSGFWMKLAWVTYG